MQESQNSNPSISDQPTLGKYKQKRGKAHSLEALQAPDCWLSHKRLSNELSQTPLGISLLIGQLLENLCLKKMEHQYLIVYVGFSDRL